MFAGPGSWHVVTIALSYTASVALYSWLPRIHVTRNPMPLGRPLVAFLLPTAALLTYVLLSSLWRRDPIRRRDVSVEKTYDAIVFRIVLFIIAIHASVVCGLMSVAGVIPPVSFALARVVPALLGLALI